MTGSDPKTDLHRYLQDAREALLWKLDGLTEYNIRRPMVPTGTNLLGLIKHVASVELGYFGDTFGRPFGERLPWLENDAEPNADMWATADESREQITGLYRRAWVHSDATIGALALALPVASSQVRRSSRNEVPMTNAAYVRPSTTRGVTSWTDPSEAVALRRAVPGLTWSAYPVGAFSPAGG